MYLLGNLAASHRLAVACDAIGNTCCFMQDNCGVALKAAREEGLSAALFAPGWVYENHERSCFHELQETFWGKVRRVRSRQLSCSIL